MAMLLFTSVLILASLAVFVNAGAYEEPLLTVTGPLGTVRDYCYIRELNLNITVGDYVKSLDTCYKYNCLTRGLEAVGYGIGEGIFATPGCRTINMACLPKFIQDPQSTIKCPIDPNGVPAKTSPTRPPGFPRPTLPSGWVECDGKLKRGHLGDLVCAGGVGQIPGREIIIVLALLTFLIYIFIN